MSRTDSEKTQAGRRNSHFLNLDEPILQTDWSEIFHRPGLKALEIGCGNGRFLARYAPLHPEFNFIGIEKSQKYAALAAQRLEKYSIPNALVGCAKAEEFLELQIPKNSLDAIHIYFSDPWPKRRHGRRRLFQWNFLSQLAQAARKGAPLHIKTDVDWYYADIVSLFIEREEFDLESYGEQMEFPPDDLEMTGFESKALRLERRVFYLNLTRK